MYSADNVLINYIRAPIIQMDPRSIGVTALAAQELGLSDGQVVHASVEVQNNRVSLILKGFLIDAPTFKIDAPSLKSNAPTFKIDAPNWNAADLKTGDTVQLKASMSTQGWVLSPSTQGAQSTSASLTSVSEAGTATVLSAQLKAQSSAQGNALNTPSTSVSPGPLDSGSQNAGSKNNAAGANANDSVGGGALSTNVGASNTKASNTKASNTQVLNTQATNSQVNNAQVKNAPVTNPKDINAGTPLTNSAISQTQQKAQLAGINAPADNRQGLSSVGSALPNSVLNAPSPSVLPSWSTRLNALIFEPAQLSVIFELLMPGELSRLLPQAQLENWLQRWNAARLSMASLNPEALKRVVLAQSRPIERQLMGSVMRPQGPVLSDVAAELGAGARLFGTDSALESDPKTMLSGLAALLEQLQETPETTKLGHQVRAAINELESAQVQTAQHLLRGEIAFHAVIPFWDADPVDLYFKKSKGNSEDDPRSNISVDIHSKSRLLGELWLNTSIKQSTQVDLVMWAIRPDVAELARTNASELGYELGVSGLTLRSFQIFNAPKPSEAPTETPYAGSVLDTRV